MNTESITAEVVQNWLDKAQLRAGTILGDSDGDDIVDAMYRQLSGRSSTPTARKRIYQVLRRLDNAEMRNASK